LYYERKVKTSEINSVCAEYLKGLMWVFEYYLVGCPSFSWTYPYHYPPLFSDFSLFLSGISSVENYINFDRTAQPLTPFVQLICVLPPQSAYLLPAKYRSLLTSETSPLKEYYPKNFEIDYEGKNQEYEGIALLPFVDLEKVKQEYNKVKGTTHRRNSISKVKIFKYDSRIITIYKSDYGSINDCHVVAV
jgi:5'-3' exonuclease